MISLDIIKDIQTMEADSLERMKIFYDYLEERYRGKDESKYNRFTAEIQKLINSEWARRAKA